jgi:hypothetical protein
VADPIVSPGCEIPGSLNILRALNPKHLEDGFPGSNHFVMKLDHERDDGVSTGIENLISIAQLRDLRAIRSIYGDKCGVAVLNVSEVLEPVRDTEVTVIQQNAVEWEEHAQAHAIITGYQSFPPGNAGRRKLREFTRHLVKLARRRFVAPGSDIESAG